MNECKLEKTDDRILLKFKNFHDFVMYAKGADDCPNADAMSRASLKAREGDFNRDTWEQTIKYGLQGWPEGLDLVIPYQEEILLKLGHKIKRHHTYHDVQGSYVDVDRFLHGEPECMVAFEDHTAFERVGTIMRIVVPISTPWYVKQKTLALRGASILALIDALEWAGHSCELFLSEPIDGNNYKGVRKSEILIKLKDADEGIDPNELAFAMIHPDVLRRLCFAVEERQDKQFREAFGIHSSGGYGTPIHDTHFQSDIPIIRADEINGEKDSNEWIEKMLKKCHLWAEE